MKDLQEFVRPLIPLGRLNSLAQTLIKLTAPGVPDIYQGMELWNLSLVDPDNRQPVDYELRRRLLRDIQCTTASEILRRTEEGLPKLWVVRRALRLRAQMPDAFGPAGAFEPVEVCGRRREHLVAFSRGLQVITIVPRLVAKLANDWEDTAVKIPEGRWKNEFTGASVGCGEVYARTLFSEFPVCLLSRD